MQPYQGTSLLADPEWRRERARKAGASRTTISYLVARVAERAAELTDEHRAELSRALRLSRKASV
jgi:putative ubiquitin-RnfH superfamily antitoxin RatB of RatAB toxin-antitoxin module